MTTTPTTLDPAVVQLDYRQFKPNKLKEGQSVLISGTVSFARIARVIKGEALQKSIAQERMHGRTHPITEPHTSLQIKNPVIMVTDPNGPTFNDQAMASRCYRSKTGKNQGEMLFNVANKGEILPVALARNPQTGAYTQVILENEPAVDLPVIIEVNIFKSPTQENRGWGISRLFFPEGIKYYQRGTSNTTLAALGITVEGPVTPMTDEQVVAAGVVVAETETEPMIENQAVIATEISPQGYALPSAAGFPDNTPTPVVQAPQQPVASPMAASIPAPLAPAAELSINDQDEIAALKAQLAKIQQAKSQTAAQAAAEAAALAAASTDPWANNPGISLPSN